MSASLLTVQVKTIYEKLPFALLAVPVNAGVLVAILWPFLQPTVACSWLAALCLLNGVRFRDYLLFRAEGLDSRGVQHWHRRLLLGAALHGLLWGVATVLLYPRGGPSYQTLLAFVIGGMVAGAAGSMAGHPRGFALFSWPAMLPLAVRLVMERDTVHVAMGILLVVFVGLLQVITTQGHRLLEETVSARLHRERLAERLEENNRTLEARVAARTAELEAAHREKETADARRERLMRELEQSRLFAHLGQLAAGVAHEINNPLAYLSSNLEFLEERLSERGRPPLELEEALSEARAGTERIGSIVADLAALAQREPERVAAVDVRSLLRRCITLVEPRIRYRARIELDLEAVPPVFADRSQLAQVFINLLTNAAESIQPGAALSNMVRVHAEVASPDQVRINITDTGAGIHPDDVEHIFDPFFTTKDLGQGTGLGLSICRSVVESVGGSIGVETALGAGTTIKVCLCAAASDTLLESQRHCSTVPPGSLRGAQVLVVDDDQLVGKGLARILRPHSVRLCTRGSEALRLLDQDPVAFAVVFCDILMPEIDGITLFRRAVDRHPELANRFVFMTGAATEAAEDFLRELANPCIRKPFQSREIRNAMHRVLTQGGLSQKAPRCAQC